MMLCYAGVECEVQQGGEPGRLCERRQVRQHLLNTCLKYTVNAIFSTSFSIQVHTEFIFKWYGMWNVGLSDGIIKDEWVFGMTQFICYVSKFMYTTIQLRGYIEVRL